MSDDGYVWIDAKYRGQCADPDCRTAIEVDDRVLYEPRHQRAYCQACGEMIKEDGDD